MTTATYKLTMSTDLRGHLSTYLSDYERLSNEARIIPGGYSQNEYEVELRFESGEREFSKLLQSKLFGVSDYDTTTSPSLDRLASIRMGVSEVEFQSTSISTSNKRQQPSDGGKSNEVDVPSFKRIRDRHFSNGTSVTEFIEKKRNKIYSAGVPYYGLTNEFVVYVNTIYKFIKSYVTSKPIKITDFPMETTGKSSFETLRNAYLSNDSSNSITDSVSSLMEDAYVKGVIEKETRVTTDPPAGKERGDDSNPFDSILSLMNSFLNSSRIKNKSVESFGCIVNLILMTKQLESKLTQPTDSVPESDIEFKTNYITCVLLPLEPSEYRSFHKDIEQLTSTRKTKPNKHDILEPYKLFYKSNLFPTKLYPTGKVFATRPMCTLKLSTETTLIKEDYPDEFASLLHQQPRQSTFSFTRQINEWEISLRHTYMVHTSAKGSANTSGKHTYACEIEYRPGRSHYSYTTDESVRSVFALMNRYMTGMMGRTLGSYYQYITLRDELPEYSRKSASSNQFSLKDIRRTGGYIHLNQPYTLSIHDTSNFTKFKTNEYCVTEKADGFRMILFTTPDGQCVITNAKFSRYHVTDRYAIPGSVIDGEYIPKTKSFYAFDILYYNYKDVTNQMLYGRHIYLDSFLGSVRLNTDPIFSVYGKTFYYETIPTRTSLPVDHLLKHTASRVSFIKQSDDLIDTAMELWKTKDTRPYGLDGVIFSPINYSYNGLYNHDPNTFQKVWVGQGNPANLMHFKWKEDISIDFLTKRSKGGTTYEFYTSNKKRIEPYTVPSIPFNVMTRDQFQNEDVSSCFSKSAMLPIPITYTPLGTRNGEGGRHESRDLHNKIVEFSYDSEKNRWDIMKVRDDKNKPNSKLVMDSMYILLSKGKESNTLQCIKDARGKRSAKPDSKKHGMVEGGTGTGTMKTILQVRKLRLGGKSVCKCYSIEKTPLDKRTIQIVFPLSMTYKQAQVTCDDLGVVLLVSVSYNTETKSFEISSLENTHPSPKEQLVYRFDLEKANGIMGGIGTGSKKSALLSNYEQLHSEYKKTKHPDLLSKMDDIQQLIYLSEDASEQNISGKDESLSTHDNRSMYDQNVSKPSTSSDIDVYHYNNLIKTSLYQLSAFQNKSSTSKKQRMFLLDYGAGKGGDISKWYKAGFTDVLAIDNSSNSIRELKERYLSRGYEKFRVTWVLGDMNRMYHDGDSSKNLKPLDRLLRVAENNHELLKLKSFLTSPGFDGGFDMISCQFAIHYVVPKVRKLFLSDTISMLQEKGLFVYTHHDMSGLRPEIVDGGSSWSFLYHPKNSNSIELLASYRKKTIRTDSGENEDVMLVSNPPVWGSGVSREYIMPSPLPLSELDPKLGVYTKIQTDSFDHPFFVSKPIHPDNPNFTELDLIRTLVPVVIQKKAGLSGKNKESITGKWRKLYTSNEVQTIVSSIFNRLMYTRANRIIHKFPSHTYTTKSFGPDKKSISTIPYSLLMGAYSSVKGKSSTLPSDFNEMFRMLVQETSKVSGKSVKDTKTFLDGTSNVGTDVFNFLSSIPFERVTAVEMGYTEYVLLNQNITRMKYDESVVSVNGNIVDYILSSPQKNPSSGQTIPPFHETVYLDPPWGGLDWRGNTENELSMEHSNGKSYSISDLVDLLVSKDFVGEFVIVKAPSNFIPKKKSILANGFVTSRLRVSSSIHVFLVDVKLWVLWVSSGVTSKNEKNNEVDTDTDKDEQMIKSEPAYVSVTSTPPSPPQPPQPYTPEYKEYVETNGILFKSSRVNQGGAFLSNFWGKTEGVSDNARRASVNAYNVNPSEGGFDAESHHFVSVEHYFQWKKAGFTDTEFQTKMFIDSTPRSNLDYKKLGSKAAYKIWKSKQSDETLSQVKAGERYTASQTEFRKHYKQIMMDAIRYKFSDQNPSLVAALLSTGDKLLGEMNGRGRSVWDIMGHPGVGYNWLGEILMGRRSELRSEQSEHSSDSTNDRTARTDTGDNVSSGVQSDVDDSTDTKQPKKRRGVTGIDWNDMDDDDDDDDE